MSCKSKQPFTSSSKDAVLVICEMGRGHLGIDGSVRCIVAENEENVFVKDTVETLKCLDIQHPAGVHVVRVCQGHKDLYGCGIKSMLFLIGQLILQVDNLMQQGVPLLYIEDLIDEALDHCIDHLQHLAVPVALSATSDTCTDNLQRSYMHVTSPLPASSNDCCRKFHHAANSEPPHLCAQRVWHQHGSGPSVFSSKETVSRTLTAGDLGLVGMTADLVISGESGKSKSHLEPVHKSSTDRTSETIPSHGKLAALNGFLQRHWKTASSAQVHKNVMLRSRHLQDCGSGEGKMGCSVSELGNSGRLSVNGHEHLDHSPHGEDVSCKLSETVYSVSALRNPERHPLSHGKFVSCPQHASNSIRCDQVSGAKKTSLSLPREAQSLSHGCHEMMSWAQQAMHRHLVHGKHLRFDASLIHTVGVQGQLGQPRLLDGLVVAACSDVMQVLAKISSPASVLLVNGDLTAGFRHLGYKATLSSTCLAEDAQSWHQPTDTWHCQVLALLDQLDVRVVLVRGRVDSDLCSACVAAGIALVDKVTFQALKVLQSACHVDFVTYILDAHESNICQGVSLKPLEEDWCDTVYFDHKHLVVTPPVFVQTLVVRSPSAAGREVQEEDFRRCAARLEQAAVDGRVLQGGGVTEKWCACLLTEQHTPPDHPDQGGMRGRWAGDVSLYRPVVRAALAEAFFTFTRTVQHNRQKAGCDSCSGQLVEEVRHRLSSVLNPTPHLCPGQKSCHSDPGGPSHQSGRTEILEVCQMSSATGLNVYPHTSRSGKDECHINSQSDHCACQVQHSTETGSCLPQPLLQDVGTSLNLGGTHCAWENHPCSGQCGNSHCAAAQTAGAREENLSKADVLHSPLQNASTGGSYSHETGVWDNLNSKVNGWRSAVQCVFTVMRMDELIITGVDQRTLPAHSVLL